MGLLKEFKDFTIKGNAIDLAVGVIIGGAFGKIVTSIIDDLIMPVVGAIIGKPDFSSLYVVLKGNVPDGTKLEEARKIADTAIFAYGNFITVAINFILLAFVIFWMIKIINNIKKKEAAAPTTPPAPSNQEVLLGEIRDLLKNK
jgi:large conductance mechanosensitive channel